MRHATASVVVVLVAALLGPMSAPLAAASTDDATFEGTVYTNEHFRMVIDGSGAGLFELGTGEPIGRVGWTVDKLEDNGWTAIAAGMTGVVTQSDDEALHVVRVGQNLTDGSGLTTIFAGWPNDRIDSGPRITGLLTAGTDATYRLRFAIRGAAVPLFEMDNRWGDVRLPSVGYMAPPPARTEFTSKANSLVFLDDSRAVHYGVNWESSASMYAGVVVSGRSGSIDAAVDFGAHSLAAGQSIGPDVIIEGGGGGGGCTPTLVSIKFYIYKSKGFIKLNGRPYANGDQTNVFAGCGLSDTVEFQLGSDTSYTYYEWESNAGSFDSAYSPLTVFHPTRAGAITAVLDQPVPSGFSSTWGGYIVSGTGITRVYGEFTLPTTASWRGRSGDGNLASDGLVIWVGIGGLPGPLWQAGIKITVTDGGSVSFMAWYSACTAASCNPVYDNSPFASQIQLGDRIYVELWYDSASGSPATSYWRVGDPSRWPLAPIGGQLPFVPDITTAEWVVEDPSCTIGGNDYSQCWVIPHTNLITFRSLTVSTYPDMVVPLTRNTMVAWNCLRNYWWPTKLWQHQTPGYVSGTTFDVSYWDAETDGWGVC